MAHWLVGLLAYSGGVARLLQPAQHAEAPTWVESTRPTRPKHVTAVAAIAAAREAGESFTIPAPSATESRRRAKREVGF